MRGHLYALLALASVSVAACTTAPVVSPGAIAQAQSRLAQAERTYATAKAFADLLAPYLPAHTAATIAILEIKIERALLAARTATTFAAQAAALAEAEAAIAVLDEPPIDKEPGSS